MRDNRFIAENRGGLLKKEQHLQFISWACDCAEHVLPLISDETDVQLIHALLVIKEFEKGFVSVGDARKASLSCISVANESSNLATIAVARAIGHAVATAHMADHAFVAALYALKAVKNSGHSPDAEKKWQNEQIPSEIRELVLSTMEQNEKKLKIDSTE